MTFVLRKGPSSIVGLQFHFTFMNRGRLWCSRNFFFRHWTWRFAPSLLRILGLFDSIHHSLVNFFFFFFFFFSHKHHCFSFLLGVPTRLVVFFTSSEEVLCCWVVLLRKVVRFWSISYLGFFFFFNCDGRNEIDSRVSVPSNWCWAGSVLSEKEGAGEEIPIWCHCWTWHI